MSCQYIKPLQNANITITSTHFDTPIRSIWMPRYILFGVDKQRFMSWHMDYLCMMDIFFDSGAIEINIFFIKSN